MSIRREGDILFLDGQCRVEDAEPLSVHLQSGAVQVDVSACELMHGAVFQALIALNAKIVGIPADATLSTWLALLPVGGEK